MGIVNVTPDSFVAAARTYDVTSALARGRELFDTGCAVVDVGGESTRPGAAPVSVADELERTVEVVRELSRWGEVSIDTRKEDVARAAVAAGASILNDVSGTLAHVAGELGVGYVAMHAQGTPETMQVNPHYGDVGAEVESFLVNLASDARRLGVDRLWIDPGIGFGKTFEHNIVLLSHLPHFADVARELGAGLLVGTSRKRFLGALYDPVLDVDDRFEGSLASAAWAFVHGATMVRVHDARETMRMLHLLETPVNEVAR
jgi:dihydropteroate synthase